MNIIEINADIERTLNKKELQILRLHINGYSYREIAIIIKRSRMYPCRVMKSIREKLSFLKM